MPEEKEKEDISPVLRKIDSIVSLEVQDGMGMDFIC